MALESPSSRLAKQLEAVLPLGHVRWVPEVTGASVNEYVVRHVVQAAEADLADRRVFVLDDRGWDDLQVLLDRPPSAKPELTRLPRNPSILEK